MPGDSRRPRSNSPPSEGRASVEEDWTQLRSLLLTPEQTQLDELRNRLDNSAIHARDVSRVLPDAFAIRGKEDQALSNALAPFVEGGFVSAVRKSPRAIVDAIAPIIGPAIRQAIARALQSMTQSLNHSLEESMSVRGVRWRLEAWRTGRPFAEVVLLHNLRYRVEQVFLIHRETGLLLRHVATESAVVQDQHMVSGMLTAIQSYVRDSFGVSQDQTLDQFQVGEWIVWIEQGSQAYLAGVIRGSPPATLREDFRDALDRIHAQQADALTDFDGNPALFKETQTDLESCLQAHYEASQQHSSRKVWILVGIILLALAWLGWTAYQAQARWSSLLAQLKVEPGIVVTAATSTWGNYHLEGLRDPLAKDPSTVVLQAGFDPSTVKATWFSYYALDPLLIAARAQSILQPPSTAKLTLEGDTLMATGSAPIEWARETKRVAPLIPGIIHYRDDSLVTISISDLLAQINQTVIHFSSGSSTLESTDLAVLGTVAVALRDVDRAASQSGQGVLLDIRGSADETGSEAMNIQLSKARADAVLAALGDGPFGQATSITTRIAPSMRPRISLGPSADRRIASLRATLTPPARGKAFLRP